MGTIDRSLRIVVAIVILILYFLEVISGTVAIVLGVVAVAFILTSFVGTCPIYMPFKLSTRKES